jgi:Kdo2-lipid IVA lauroyltransferase/acyltransferase
MLGWAIYWGSPTYRRRFVLNAQSAGVAGSALRTAVGAAGQMVLELPRLWLGAAVPVSWDGDAHIDAAFASGRGVVFLTPHLGCFEVTAQAYAARYGQDGHPMTVLFRPPRMAWLSKWVVASRARPGLQTAPATLGGVKQLLKALKKGQCVGLLPDQVPPRHMGIWSPFFGQPAYTMTLSARLAQQSGAVVLLAWGERLPCGAGYVVHVAPMEETLHPDLVLAVRQINGAMESLISRHPGQYLWGYARYKTPREEL